jgi:pimeloyl-ACP methyl ester carboxylesterase
MLGVSFLVQLTSVAPDTGGFTASGIWFRVSGTGPAVLLVHGSNLDSRSLAPLASALAGTHTVIEADLRFHGRSRDGTGPFAFDRDMIEVLDAAAVARATVIGHSLGAAVALDMVLAAPTRVERLVLIGPSIGGKAATRPPAGFDAVVRALQANDLQQAGVALGNAPVMALVRDTTGQAMVRGMVADNVRLFRADRRRVVPTGAPAIGRLGEVAVPVLVLTGSADPTEAVEAARELLARVPGATGETIDRCGHLMPLDCGADVVRAIRAFLGSR